jgi:radical SAM superfamily enzyme YgiQ (UPF0313 family)
MKVVLISANTESINMPVIPVGLGAVAAATKEAGHEVALVDLLNAADPHETVEQAIEALRPDVIGISVRNVDDQRMDGPVFLLDRVKPVISRCRLLSNAPIVLGGAGYSMFPESALAYLGADMGIQGEGEVAFPLLVDLMAQQADLSAVPGLYLAGRGLQAERKFLKALDGLPFADSRAWSALAAGTPDLWVPVQTRRGCPMKCSYCSTSMIEGCIIRKRSPERVADAMTPYVDNGFRRFFLTDNTFNLPMSYARRLCQVLTQRGLDIAWRCIFHPGHVDEAMVKDMARAGCREVSLGFESGSERILGNMHKGFSLQDIRRASEMLAAHGIRRMGFLLLGGPGESRETVEESLAFGESLRLEAMKITVGIRIYPGTPLARRAVAEGVIRPDDDLLFPRFYLARECEGWLQNAVHDWMAEHPNWMR